MNDSSKLAAIFGYSRSGTTWLGSILASHPEVIYRFEPFHRLASKYPDFARVREKFSSGSVSSQELDFIEHILSPAYPECEKPPFFKKNAVRYPGKSILWSLSRKYKFFYDLYKRFYKPSNHFAKLIFKEVELVDVFSNLALNSNIPLIYILRHPCGVVNSTLKGQQKNLMPSIRRTNGLKNILSRSKTLSKEYAHCVDKLSVVEQEALLWLIETEHCLQTCCSSANTLLVIYEELVESPMDVASKVFEHLNLKVTPEVESYIKESMFSGSQINKVKRGEVGINPYFTVFRDSNHVAYKWKEELAQDGQSAIINLLRNSLPYKTGLSTGFWD
jgi:hypothetical protein